MVRGAEYFFNGIFKKMKTYFVVTGIVRHKGKILVLQKSDNDYNYPGKWSLCSGYVKEFESAEDTLLREIKEETGLKAKLQGKGKLIHVKDKNKNKSWVIVVFPCSVKSGKVNLCHENKNFKWIKPKELKSLDTVPGLKKDIAKTGLI